VSARSRFLNLVVARGCRALPGLRAPARSAHSNVDMIDEQRRFSALAQPSVRRAHEVTLSRKEWRNGSVLLDGDTLGWGIVFLIGPLFPWLGTRKSWQPQRSRDFRRAHGRNMRAQPVLTLDRRVDFKHQSGDQS